MKKRKLKRAVTALLSALMLLAALPVAALADSATGFPDVPEGAWYVKALHDMQVNTPGIISGLKVDGVLVFQPDRPVLRGEFLKMAMTAAEGYTADKSRNNNPHWAGEYYTIALENNILTPNILGSENHDGSAPEKTAVATELFPYTDDEMQKEISRYEMAVIIKNTCTNMLREKTVNASDVAQNIKDYDIISSSYTIYEDAVVQAYGKGLLTGYPEDGMFHGDRNLRRCEAAMVIYRMLWANERSMPEWAAYPEATSNGTYLLDDPGNSFAHWLNGTGNFAGQGRHYGYPNGRTTLYDDAKIKLYGYATVDHVFSSSHASQLGCMETVSVPIWTVDAWGQKIPSTVGIVVNKAVADEVHDIFQTIFDDPEQFPIYGGWSAGGARYTDDMRHSWGCAIDINALYNCECNTKKGYVRVTCGYGWWPYGTVQSIYSGSLTAPSIYSIGKNPGDYGHSVVEAFAKYGWGWGGNGWSNGTSFDFMHFSVLSSGG